MFICTKGIKVNLLTVEREEKEESVQELLNLKEDRSRLIQCLASHCKMKLRGPKFAGPMVVWVFRKTISAYVFLLAEHARYK